MNIGKLKDTDNGLKGIVVFRIKVEEVTGLAEEW